jgi:hypothetical protein
MEAVANAFPRRLADAQSARVLAAAAASATDYEIPVATAGAYAEGRPTPCASSHAATCAADAALQLVL